jgi:hypothetical protein
MSGCGCYTYLLCGFPEPRFVISIVPISTFGFMWNKEKITVKVRENKL